MTQNKLKHVKIVFAVPPDKYEETILGRKERILDANTILINDIFKQRMNHLKENNQLYSKEAHILIVYLGISILHEICHLVLRRKGNLDPPDIIGDPGDYVENRFYKCKKEIKDLQDCNSNLNNDLKDSKEELQQIKSSQKVLKGTKDEEI